jgi:hypothetical protein
MSSTNRKHGRNKRAPSNKLQRERTSANKARRIQANGDFLNSCHRRRNDLTRGFSANTPKGTARAKRRGNQCSVLSVTLL